MSDISICLSLRDFISARGYSLDKLSIHWLCSAVGCVYEQVSAEFVFDFLGRSCPLLRELDVSGLKNVSALSLQQLLDTKLAQVRNWLTKIAEICWSILSIHQVFSLIAAHSQTLSLKTVGSLSWWLGAYEVNQGEIHRKHEGSSGAISFQFPSLSKIRGVRILYMKTI